MSPAFPSWNRRIRRAAVVVAVAVLVALELTAFWYFSNLGETEGQLPNVLRTNFTAFGFWAATVPLVTWVARQFPLDVRPRLGNMVIHLLAALVIISFIIATFVTVAFFAYRQYSEPTWWAAFRHVWPRYFPFDLAVYAFILLGWYAFHWHGRYRDRELRTAQLEASLHEARLAALRSQLNPHFLFNALNSVSALMHRNVDAADAMLARIGELLRLTLASDGDQEVELREELELLDRYLDVERIRFAERLAITVDVPASTLGARIPPFSLQPLVENAIHHGVAITADGGRVTISARKVEERLQLRVLDDGPGLATPHLREGVGLRNTRARLRQLYGESQQLLFRRPEGGGLEVMVELPWRT
jgi:hypothetical protein